MKKILYVTHLSGKRVNRFWISSIKAAHELGMEFHLACNMSGADEEHWKTECEEYGIITHQIDFVRSPYSPRNIKAYQQMKKLLSDQNFEIIHCNTPIGGVVTRLAAHAVKARKVIYQAHGFHFWKGAPLVNWLLYFPVEWFLAHYTDVLITINKEDYVRARKFAAKRVCYVPGVGIDTIKFALDSETKNKKSAAIRNELGIPESSPMLLSVGEVNDNKNHRVVIEALSKLEDKNVHYVICGCGPLVESHKHLAQKLGVEKRVHFPGFRSDVPDFYQAADIFVFPSLREGLSVALMEAISSDIPVVCAAIRGNTDLIDDKVTGYTIENDSVDVARTIQYVIDHEEERRNCAAAARKKLMEFDFACVLQNLRNIYLAVFEK